jgi:RNA-splicing ligase RtcB
MEITGKFTTIDLKSEIVEDSAFKQLLNIANQAVFTKAGIKIMPDVHAGIGSVIGFTMPLTDFIIPNIVGVDISCGMTSAFFNTDTIDYSALDETIRNKIPHGQNVQRGFDRVARKYFTDVEALAVLCKKVGMDFDRACCSIGSLGSGNHFIEVGQSQTNEYCLTVHSGSRQLGMKVANYHQAKANRFIEECGVTGVDRELCYLVAEDMVEYINDCRLVKQYAEANRLTMIENIMTAMTWRTNRTVNCNHNEVGIDGFLRKGAISARENESVIIPFNMRDGILFGKGKGNPDWNYSAPHGAGRVLSRNKAKELLSIDEFKDTMSSVWTSCVSPNTLDESPMAYKPVDEVIARLEETVEITEIVKPLYNFKSN